jgi:hypothetical protein
MELKRLSTLHLDLTNNRVWRRLVPQNGINK